MLSRLRLFLSGVFQRGDFEQNLADEIHFHLEQRAEDLRQSGLSESEARRRARLEFGKLETYKEQCRQAFGLRVVDELRGDIRYALRNYAKKPLFPIIVLFSLAFGIGTNTAFFSFIDRIILQPLPVRDPWTLYDVQGRNQSRRQIRTFSLTEYQEIRDQNQTFQQVIAYAGLNPNTPNGTLTGLMVSGNYFEALGVQPALGRTLIPGDDQPSFDPVVVLSNFAWQHHFGSDPAIVGNPIEMAGHHFTVIGVTSPGFTGLDPMPDSFWVPLSTRQWFTDQSLAANDRSDLPLRIVGRLNPEISSEQAQASLSILLSKLTEGREETWRLTEATLKSHAHVISWTTKEWLNATPMIWLFTAVLLIAWSNLAGVQLSRILSRQREISVRLSLGATRSRLVRQLVTEVAPLIFIGTLLGLLLSYWIWVFSRSLIPETYWEFAAATPFDPQMNFHIIGYVVFLTLLTLITIGLLPAWKATHLNLTSALKGEGTILGQGVSQSRFRNGLIILQFTVTMALLVGAGALVRAQMKVADTPLGFDASHCLHIEVTNQASRPRLMQILSNIPGVVAVASSYIELPSQSNITIPVSINPTDTRVETSGFNDVTADYFKVLEIPTVLGRTFTEQEVDTNASVAVISQAAARRFWPDGNAVGQQLSVTFDKSYTVEVIGVVGNYREPGSDTDMACIYLPVEPKERTSHFVVSVAGSPGGMLNDVQTAVRTGYPTAEFTIFTMSYELFGFSLQYAISALVSGIVGFIGLLLAAIGIYGIIASTVSRRTKEIGIRMALGAERRDVLRLILREGLRLIWIAVGCGLIMSLLLSRVFAASNALKLADPTNPLAIALAVIILGAIGLLAIYIPARKATRIEPSVALRYE